MNRRTFFRLVVFLSFGVVVSAVYPQTVIINSEGGKSAITPDGGQHGAVTNQRDVPEVARDPFRLEGMARGPRASEDPKWRRRLREMRVIDPVDIEKYKNFLAKGRGGAFRLLPDFDCIAKDVIKIDGACSNFVPDMSDFSFRSKQYADKNYFDIEYNRNELTARSFFSHGIGVSLGDVPIANVTLSTVGLKYLLSLSPAQNFSAALDIEKKLTRGAVDGGFFYSNHFKVVPNTTYVLRTIAYKLGNILPISPTNRTQVKFLGVEYDRRFDTVIVFRILDRDQFGGVTIVWKELSRHAAPKIKFRNGERFADFR